MTENPETLRLLMNAIERIDTKLEALDSKFERKMDQLNQKLDVNLRELQDDLLQVKEDFSRIDLQCKARICRADESEQELKVLKERCLALEKQIDRLQNNEWRLFFRSLGKAAAYIVAIGTAIVLLQQIFGVGNVISTYLTPPTTAPTP